MRILIKNGYVVSMVSDIKKADILIEDDRIKKIGIINEEVDKVIDATNKAVMPGLINAMFIQLCLFLEVITTNWNL